MIMPNETFNNSFPYPPHYMETAGFKMHYIDEGPQEAEVMLCLHGEPTWGYLFRHLIQTLRHHYRIIVPDHMGFGKSETPQNRTYWLQDHIDNLECLVLSLRLQNITLVMHDFGGPTGMGLAARHPDRIRRIISINAPTPFGQSDLVERITANAQASPWFQWIIKAEKDGSLENVLGQLNFNILSALKLNGFECNDLITDTWLAAYSSHFVNPADCAGAIGWAKGFAIGAHKFEAPDAAAIRTISAIPALAIWGTADRTLKAEQFLPLFAAIFPQAPIHRLEGVGHYSLEDAPNKIEAIVTQFVERT